MADQPKQLFRQEAIDAQREKLLVRSLSPIQCRSGVHRPGARLCRRAGCVLHMGEYSRRERVDGFLALDVGAARILAPEAGTVAELLAKEGDEVDAGQPLIRLSFERGTASG